MDFGTRIKQRRVALDLTLDEVAQASGVAKATVQRWETGEIKNIRIEKLEPLAKALKTTTAYLQGYVDDPAAKIRLYSLSIPGENGGSSTIMQATSPEGLAGGVVDFMKDEAAELLLDAVKNLCAVDLVADDGKRYAVFACERVKIIADFIRDNEKSLKMMIDASEGKK